MDNSDIITNCLALIEHNSKEIARHEGVLIESKNLISQVKMWSREYNTVNQLREIVESYTDNIIRNMTVNNNMLKQIIKQLTEGNMKEDKTKKSGEWTAVTFQEIFDKMKRAGVDVVGVRTVCCADKPDPDIREQLDMQKALADILKPCAVELEKEGFDYRYLSYLLVHLRYSVGFPPA